jgi:hypothetical protein
MGKFDIERFINEAKLPAEGVPKEAKVPQPAPAPEQDEELETEPVAEHVKINKLAVSWQEDEYDPMQVAMDFYDFIHEDPKLDKLLQAARLQFERLWKIADKQAKKKYKGDYNYDDIIESIADHVREMDVDELDVVDVFFFRA